MISSSKYSFFGGALALILAFSCCWLPLLIVALGSAAGLASFSSGLERFSGPLMFVGAALLGIGAYQLYKRKTESAIQEVVLISNITCPECGHSKDEEMPQTACQYFYDCENCQAILKPKNGDCCVYCSYGSVPCPPIQKNEECCV